MPRRTQYEFAQVMVKVEELRKKGDTDRKICSKIASKFGFSAEALRRRIQRNSAHTDPVIMKKKVKKSKEKKENLCYH